VKVVLDCLIISFWSSWSLDFTTRSRHLHIACRSICHWYQESRLVKIILDCLIGPARSSWSLDFTVVQ